MASDDLDPRDENYNKRRAMMAEDPRFVHLEGRVDRLETDVRDIKGMVQKLVDRPVNPGLTQVLGTLVSTLVAVGIVFGFYKYNLNEAMLPLASQIAAVKVEMNERFEILARKIEKTDDISVEARVKAGILEERSIWMRSQSSWAAKDEKPSR